MKKTYQLQPELTIEELQQVIGRYHFRDTDLKLLRDVYVMMQKLLLTEAFCRLTETANSVIVIMTLGSEIDRLQDAYQHEENLLKSYMVECLGMELLTKAHKELDGRIHVETGKYPADCSYYGADIPLEQMENAFASILPKGVRYNQAYMMTPRKSVAYTAQLTESPPICGQEPCASCGSKNCTVRKTDRR